MLATRRPAASRLFHRLPVVLPVVRDQIVQNLFTQVLYMSSPSATAAASALSDDVSSSCSPATSTRTMAHLRELAPRKKMLTLLPATRDVDTSEAAVLTTRAQLTIRAHN